jgi:hypothetical protein
VLAPWAAIRTCTGALFWAGMVCGTDGTDGGVGRRRRGNIPMLGNGTQLVTISDNYCCSY